MKEFYGRGPVGTRTYYHDDYVLVLLAGGFSKVEDTLMAAGRGAAVADQREQFQEMMRGRFVEAIEEITGRSVVSFMSANDQEGDAMAELFLLRPIRETVDPPEQT